ncbi:hypothetical protein [Paraburkholderia phosphatilytica]|uniref:hypothetical protein n=1 Tax=Paraburkholderia phosphatilytica TaxID=2282883 RepID=UPI000E522D8E|nr:hypothetical protein [Paraburkholderia phosphatilytica]
MRKSTIVGALLAYSIVAAAAVHADTSSLHVVAQYELPDPQSIWKGDYNTVYVIEDAQRNVTCYFAHGHRDGDFGISCLRGVK